MELITLGAPALSAVVLGFIAHLIGDYLIQSDWMALEKTKRWWPAVVHAVTYGLPFLLLTHSVIALAVIVGSHAVIDHYRLARHVVYVKNFIAPRSYWHPWDECSGTGYHQDRPPWMTVWLMIIADNTIHVVINSAVLALAVTQGWI
ncbi:DUF3307 domain-containing protein [Nocardia wallacei]|uniref:DUF3307 domain-containing protein n=1 Tax=Nocardia wallacei TaxID=480035 RepID=UPI00313B9089